MKHPAFQSILTAALLTAGCGSATGLFQATGGNSALQAKAAQPAAPMAFFDKEAIFPAAKRLIESAQTDIYIDMFFMGGKIGEEFATLLVAKKKAGLDVKFLYDPGMGYKEAIQSTVRPVMKQLKDGGVETRTFPIGKLRGIAPIKADHNKALIIDGKTAMVGGMNIADVNAPNHDLMVQVSGSSAKFMKSVFNQNWMAAAGKDTQAEDFADEDIVEAPQAVGTPGGTPTAEDSVSVTNSGLYGFPTRPQITSLIDNAKKRIWLEMFVLADDKMCDRLNAAAKRGVEVKIITDPNKFAFAVNMGGMPNLGAVKKFKDTPVQIQFYNTKADQQMHIKMCLFDDDKVAVGSTNWTKAGFDTNNETTLIIRSTRLANQLARAFEVDWESATNANPSAQSSSWFRGTVADYISFLF